MEQMLAAYDRHGGNIIAVEEVPDGSDPSIRHRLASGEEFGQTFEITGMVEKPPKGTAPSNYIISGRYILQPEIFDILSSQEKGAGGEIQLTDAMIRLMKEQQFFGMKYEGRTYDTGSKIGFLMANVAYALEREDLGPDFRAELEAFLKQGWTRPNLAPLRRLLLRPHCPCGMRRRIRRVRPEPPRAERFPSEVDPVHRWDASHPETRADPTGREPALEGLPWHLRISKPIRPTRPSHPRSGP